MDITKIPAPAYAVEEGTASAEERRKTKEAADALDNSFQWDDTAEGEDFWQAVYDRLEAIANGESLK